MIYRNFIAPSRDFTQCANALIRHPRLNSDAVRLLTWQLSLHPGKRETLSQTATRARIGAVAFQRAKRQLKDEGFLHERRVQVGRGRWITQQLVSSEPLSAGQAAKILAATPMGDTPQVAPSDRVPAVGRPTPPPADRLPRTQDGEDKTSVPPEGAEAGAGAAAEPSGQGPEPSEQLERGRAFVACLHLLSPALRHIPVGMHDELARLAARWFDAGHTTADVQEHVLRSLPGGGTPVHRPGGLVRYLLRDVPPRELPAPPPPRGSARLAGTRECEGRHDQATLFRPEGDEVLCRACRATAPAGSGSA